MKHTVQEEMSGILTFIGILWGVFLLDSVLPGDWNTWGLIPRELWGLTGIPLAPFLHANLSHLISNTIPLVVLLVLMAGSHSRTWETVIEITMAGGALLWIFGRGGRVHVGASGLVYGLIAFLIVAGFREKRILPLIVAIFVGFLYGTTLVSGVLPSVGSNVSWDGHLFGAIAGVGVAFLTTGRNESSRASVEGSNT